jgi:membrane protein YdbS with pleckstrin-like domain
MLVGRGEEVQLDARPHGIVLARPFGKALAIASAGGLVASLGWPATPFGAVAVAVGALVALRAVWRWERTRVLVTSERLLVFSGTVRRRGTSIRLARLGPVEVEQGVLGRLLGYGTLVAGELEIPYVARPREVCRLLG